MRPFPKLRVKLRTGLTEWKTGLANDNLSLLIYAKVERPEPVVVNATPVEVLTPELTPPDEEPSPAPEEEPQPIQEGSAAAAEVSDFLHALPSWPHPLIASCL
jgi:hypothetical protein